MTVEGENDDISGVGQYAGGPRPLHRHPGQADKEHVECPEVGHYGVFNGSRFREEIYPRVASFIRRFDDYDIEWGLWNRCRDPIGYGPVAADGPSAAAFTFARA